MATAAFDPDAYLAAPAAAPAAGGFDPDAYLAAPAEKPGIMARIGAGAAGLVSGAAELVGLGSPVEIAEMAAGRQPAQHFGAPGPFGATAEQVRGVEQQTRGVTPGGLVKGAVQGIVQPFKTIGSAIVNPPQTLGQAYDVGKAVPQAAATLEGGRGALKGIAGAAQRLPGAIERGVQTAQKIGRGQTAQEATTLAQAELDAKEKAAAHYESTTGTKWETVPADLQKVMTQIVQESGDLSKLDPKAIERYTRLQKLGIPATRGQVTRDLAQLTREENLTKTTLGQPIRDISTAQDVRLNGLLDELKGKEAKATTRTAVGESVQGALRSRSQSLKSQTNQLYKRAEEVAANAPPVEIASLQTLAEEPEFLRNAPFLKQSLKAYAKDGNALNINQLERIRQEASAGSRTPGTAGHYAKEVTKAIDGILDGENVGTPEYRAAREAYKDMKNEFDKQGRVAKLVQEKGYTTDRAVALEDTLDHVLRGSADDIGKIKKSLLQGGDKGHQAWQDLRGATIEFLRERATGRRMVPGERGQLQFNSTFLDAFNEMEADGKLQKIFKPNEMVQLKQIRDAVRDVRTKPSGRIAGSDTTPRGMAVIESGLAGLLSKGLEKVPVVGKPLVEAAKSAVEKIAQRKQVKEAVEPMTLLEDKKPKKPTRKPITLKDREKAAIPLIAITRGQQDQRDSAQ